MERAAAKHKLLQDRLKMVVPTSFKGAMYQVQHLSLAALDALVYSASSPNMRSSLLRSSEKVRFLGEGKAQLYNDATSEWKGVRTYYAWYVADGRRAGNKGTKYYAWMKNPADPRPDTWEGWLTARDQGRAVLTHKVRAVAARNWRGAAIAQARSSKIVVKKLQTDVQKAVKDAGIGTG